MKLRDQISFPKPSALLRDGLLLWDRVVPSRGVPALCYHKLCEGDAADRHPLAVSRARFEAQMAFLAAAGYRTIPAREALAEVPRDDRCVVLTFDDGHADALEIAAPILNRWGFTATVFPVTGWIGREGWLDHRSGDRLDAPRTAADLPTRFLNWDELRALREMGWEVGGHTCTHAPLLDLAPHERWEEVVASKQRLEANLGAAVEVFAYPYRSYGAGPAAEVRAAGYRVAFALEPGLNGPWVDPMSARRAAVRGWHDLRDVELRLTGRYPLFRRIADALERRERPEPQAAAPAASSRLSRVPTGNRQPSTANTPQARRAGRAP